MVQALGVAFDVTAPCYGAGTCNAVLLCAANEGYMVFEQHAHIGYLSPSAS